MKGLSIFLIILITFSFYDHTRSHFLHLKKANKNYRLEEECEYECQYGVCNDGDCFCKAGFGGSNCSISNYIILIYIIELTSDDFKFTTVQFLLALIGSALGGLLIGYAVFFISMLIFNRKEVLNSSRDLSFRENWDLPKKERIHI